MATTTLTTQTTTTGLSTAELDAELLSELPEREEMCGFHHWHSCWHPCYVYSYPPSYDFYQSSTVVTSVSTVSQVIR